MTNMRDCYMIENVAVESPRDLIGTVAVPRLGRDRGRPCIVVGWSGLGEDGGRWRALIADGRLHKAGRPKKKNMRHLLFTKFRPEAVRQAAQAGGQFTDRGIREGLAAYAGLEAAPMHASRASPGRSGVGGAHIC